MTKDKVEAKEVELSDKQQYLQLQLTDLNNKEKNLMFQLDQVKASQQVFNQAFIEASQEVAEEVLKEEEK
jgi:signal transduction protein with GAF and PtsI domain